MLLFYIQLNSCASYAESWVGMLAPQVGLCFPNPVLPMAHCIHSLWHVSPLGAGFLSWNGDGVAFRSS